MNKIALNLLGIGMAVGLISTANAHEAHHHGPAPACPHADVAGTALSCAEAATPAFGPDGRLWLAWAAGGKVMLSVSDNGGTSFAPAVAVSGEPAAIDAGGEARPKVVPLADGDLVVAWTVRRDEAYSGTLLLARSTDGGRSFTAPRPLDGAGNAASRRFEVLAQASNGRLYAAWIDKRNLAAARAAGRSYAGAALAIAWSDDGGRSFSASRVVADHSCECCRVAMALATDGSPVLGWRHIFGTNLRDHAVAALTPTGLTEPVRVAEDDWAVDACPHHGPSLAIGEGGSYHLAWYTGGQRRQGLFYARSEGPGKAFSVPMGLGDPNGGASHPQLLAVGKRLFLAWKEFAGDNTEIRVMSSDDDGRHWSEARTLAATAGASDHPILVGDGKRGYLSWLTRADGYRLIALDAGDGR